LGRAGIRKGIGNEFGLLVDVFVEMWRISWGRFIGRYNWEFVISNVV